MDKALTRSSRFLGLSGLAGIAFGLIALIWPGASLVALIALFGAFALVYGAMFLAAGLNLLAHKRTDWGAVRGGRVGGHRHRSSHVLPAGRHGAGSHLFHRRMGDRHGPLRDRGGCGQHGEIQGDWLLGLSGLVSIVFGALVAIRPGDGALAILWLIGIYAIIGGVARLVFAYRMYSTRETVRGVVRGAEARP